MNSQSKLNDGIEPARNFSNYKVTVNDANLPSGVKFQ
jgi:hypothetical protein